MAQWSQDELNRTIDEVKRRSLIDPGFRNLALSNAAAAIAKINPKPLPTGFMMEFTETVTEMPSTTTPRCLTIVLPEVPKEAGELSDAELEQAAGGKTDIKLPPDWERGW